jgi:hypothetical protein
MNNRPVEVAVLRRQSHPIIINLAIYVCDGDVMKYTAWQPLLSEDSTAEFL